MKKLTEEQREESRLRKNLIGRQRHAANLEEERARSRNYHASHKEEAKIYRSNITPEQLQRRRDRDKQRREDMTSEQLEQKRVYNKQHHQKYRDSILESQKKYYRRNKERFRDYDMRIRYGITLEQYNELAVIQNNKCAICGIHQKELSKALHIDHNHNSGKIRGLLCDKCNRLLGYAIENIDTLNAAIEYLIKNK